MSGLALPGAQGGAIEEDRNRPAEDNVNETGSISKDAESDEGDVVEYSQAPQKNNAVGIYASAPPRPPVDYSSFGAFCSSSWTRFKSLWTKRFTWALIVSH